jgi:DNA-binding Lrp family transcriptional regulator
MTRRRRKTEAFDEKDEAIIHCIEMDRGILLKKIPSALEKSGGPLIPYPTVQRHVNKLAENGVLRRTFSIDWGKAGYLVRYRVGVLIDPVALRDSSIGNKRYDTQQGLADYIMRDLVQEDRFKNKLVVDDVYILLGGNIDLAIDFFARDDRTATQFIIDALRGLPGISNTVSAKLAYSSKEGWLSRNGEA